MANQQIRLMTFLQRVPAQILIPPEVTLTGGRLTTSHYYSWRDIAGIYPWYQFNLPTIIGRYYQILHDATIQRDEMPTTPAEAVNSEDMVRDHATIYFKD